MCMHSGRKRVKAYAPEASNFRPAPSVLYAQRKKRLFMAQGPGGGGGGGGNRLKKIYTQYNCNIIDQ